MITKKAASTLLIEGAIDPRKQSRAVQGGHKENKKSVGKVLERKPSISKTDARYWQQPGKLRKWNESPNYCVWIQFKGKRLSLPTHSPNQVSAAKTAAGIYKDLITLGTEATIAKHRGITSNERTATVGEWIEAAKKVSDVNPASFNCYACSLRKIVGDILAIQRTEKRFGPRKGGAADYRKAIDATSLEVLSLPKVQEWRLAYVAKAKNPAKSRSATTSCNSTIRQARSLFAPKVVKFLPDLILPQPLPFAGVEFFPRQSARYFSKIDPKALLQSAKRELESSEPAAFLALLLALGAGLRRGEIDSLCWHQIDTRRGLIRVEVTESASLKTQDSRGEVEIDDRLATVLQGFKAKAKGPFVIEVEEKEVKKSRKPKKPENETSGPRVWGQHYRADAVFDKLTAWLRGQGIDAKKPLHELRKELGALITSEHGIYAASRALRHSNVATTAAHYADKKERTTVNIGGWLEPENVTPMPSQEENSQKKIA
jgi:integrase